MLLPFAKVAIASDRKTNISCCRDFWSIFYVLTEAIDGTIGAEFIEPDLVITKDGHLICAHDINIDTVTDVNDRPEFASRKKTVTLNNGVEITGWFTDDFTLEEIKRLRVKQRLTSRDQFYNGIFTIPTFHEVLSLLQTMNKELNLNVGIYPETKHPTYFESKGLSFDNVLLDTLRQFGYPIKGSSCSESKVYIQSFEEQNLRRLRNLTDLRLIQLINHPWNRSEDTQKRPMEILTLSGLEQIASYADGISPNKRYFFDFAEYRPYLNEHTLRGVELVNEAHKRGLLVHTWTFTNVREDNIITKYFNGSETKEYLYFYEIGIDGLFTENVAGALEARKLFYLLKRQPHIQHDSLSDYSDQTRKIIWNILLIVSGALFGGMIGWGLSPLCSKPPKHQTKMSHPKLLQHKEISRTRKMLTAPAQ
jgi:glycerophosphoryl diester phosphodiesterase